MELPSNTPLVLYDGHCALCNGFVKIILKLDKAHYFHFAALQSEVGKYYLGLNQIGDEVDSIVLIDQSKVFLYEQAAYQIAKKLVFPAKLILIAKILPATWQRKLYLKIAANRYQWFGKYDACPLPPLAFRHRFH
jgi:predicted DCC family thiol-disulfide oxidoreductase YuxK